MSTYSLFLYSLLLFFGNFILEKKMDLDYVYLNTVPNSKPLTQTHRPEEV